MDAAREFRKRRISEAFEVLRDGSISPPPKRNTSAKNGHVQTHAPTDMTAVEGQVPLRSDKSKVERPKPKAVPSPVQLNFIEELPAISNVNTISLGSILGDPMIKECWLFNYLFDLDFVMKHFDPDTRELVQIKVIHGSWKREDMNGIGIEEAAKRYHNIQIIKAYMPEMYGTHHSKMIVLFRHDDLAQVILLTANFIERDWRMSQAIWKTPLLPLQRPNSTPPNSLPLPPLGSGPRFKHDLLAYYLGYGATKLQPLISQLQQYDFSEVRGALIASIPGKHPIDALDIEKSPLWGWPALKHILSHIPSTNIPSTSNPENQNQNQPQIVIQISSIASLPENWLFKIFLPALSTTLPTHIPSPKPKFSIIFPTPSEIRNSIDGYASGSSIHMKISSPAQANQLKALKPMLCHWGSSDQHQPSPATVHPSSILQGIHGEAPAPQSPSFPLSSIRSAHRAKAAPHIKTYIRFTSPSMEKIDFAMMTSANLSTQAWGASPPPQSGGKLRVCSYEIGVVVWPGLWDEEGERAEMVPVFGEGDNDGGEGEGEEEGKGGEARKGGGVRIEWRMPYDLPLVPYWDDETPWSAEVPCREPDRFGNRWMGYGS